MPIRGVLDLQRRSVPLGEIRIGESEPIPGKSGRRPVRRDTFRFTTPVEETAAAIAERLGGKPAPWDRRKGYWVVDTNHAKIDVWVPPRGLAVDAWMEMWDGGRCLRRCDGLTETRSGQACLCPQPQNRDDPGDVERAANERRRLAGLKPPQGCKPLTRINLAIPWLPGAIGVWRLNTGSANAAVETADTGQILEQARSLDVYLPALLLIHWRPGQDGHPYPVPVLAPRPSAEQIAQLPAGVDGMLAMLSGGNGPLALTAGSAAQVPANGGKTAAAAPVEPPKAAPPAAPPTGRRSRRTAQDIADDALQATTREEIRTLIGEARALRCGDDHVFTDPGQEIQEELRPFLTGLWNTLPSAGGSAA